MPEKNNQKQPTQKLAKVLIPISSIDPEHLQSLADTINGVFLKIDVSEKGFTLHKIDDQTTVVAFIGSTSEKTFVTWAEAIGHSNQSPIKTGVGKLQDHEIENLRTRYVYVTHVTQNFLGDYGIPYRSTPTIAKIARHALKR